MPSQWGPSDWGEPFEEDTSSGRDRLLRDLVMPGHFDESDFPPADGHCYLNQFESMIMEDIMDRNVTEGSSLDVLASADPHPVMESTCMEFKELKYRFGNGQMPFDVAIGTLQAYFGRYLSAFRNTCGGSLIVGVSDMTKIVSGVRFSNKEVDIIETHFNSRLMYQFQPSSLINPLDLKLQFIPLPKSKEQSDKSNEETCSYMYIIILSIFRGRSVKSGTNTPYLLWEGKAYRRKGSTTETLPPALVDLDLPELFKREEAAALGPEALRQYGLTQLPAGAARDACVEGAAMAKHAAALPIAAFREHIRKTIIENRLVIVTGGTGCGKSSMLPYYLWKDQALFSGSPRILISQPKRVPTVKIAERFAMINATPLGMHVGYQIGGRNMTCANTMVTFCTNGVLYEKLKNRDEGHLFPYDILVLDEAHEGDLYGTVCLTLLLNELRLDPSKKLIVMSATLLLSSLRDYLNEFRVEIGQVGDYPHISIDARRHDIREVYLDDPCLHNSLPEGFVGHTVFRQAGQPGTTVRLPSDTWNVIVDIVTGIDRNKGLRHCSRLPDQEGYSSVLVFLPGIGHIREVEMILFQRNMAKQARKRGLLFDVVTLHSTLTQV